MDQNQLQLHMQNNTLDQAAGELERERAGAEVNGALDKAALAANDLGVVYTLLGRMEEARATLGQAQQLFVELNDAAGQGRATGNLAQVEEHAGNADAVGALFMQAADLLHEGGAFADEYATRKRLSRFYLSRGATMQALSENAKALSIKPDANAWDKLLGRIYAVPLKLMGGT
jgi:tetratricopeptide (TPR) repeat protein